MFVTNRELQSTKWLENVWKKNVNVKREKPVSAAQWIERNNSRKYSCLHMCGFCKCRFLHEILLQTQAILKLAASQHRQEHRLHQAPVYPSHMALQTSHGTALLTPLMQSKDSNFSLVRWLPSSNRPNTLIRPRDQFDLYATCKQHRLKLCSSSQTWR